MTHGDRPVTSHRAPNGPSGVVPASGVPVGDLTGRTFIVTGANAGIGKATTEALCARGARVHLACRSAEKTRPLVDDLRARHGERAAEFLALDLADLTSVRAAAGAYLGTDEPLHVLINNAGLGSVKGSTKQGFELTFGTNHLGPFLFTTLLLDRIKASAPARIVFVSSTTHHSARGIDFDRVRGPTSLTGLPEYAVSKLANVLCANELARRLAGTGVTTYSLHPGTVKSEIWKPLPKIIRELMFVVRGMISNEEGALTSIYCATAPELAAHTGRYYAKSAEARMSKHASNEALARKLWEFSESATS